MFLREREDVTYLTKAIIYRNALNPHCLQARNGSTHACPDGSAIETGIGGSHVGTTWDHRSASDSIQEYTGFK